MKCKLCKGEFSDESYKNKIYCSSKCKSKAYYYANQGNCYTNQKDRGLIRKLDLIERSGGKCETCGYDKNMAALTFHHIDPKIKSFELDMRHLSNRSQKVIDEEFEKCMLLCANCHFELHNPTYDKENMVKYAGQKPKISISSKITKEKKQKLNKECEKCNIVIKSDRKLCDNCLHEFKSRERPEYHKIEHPTKEILEKEIWQMSTVQLSKKYGVSDKAIEKWCKKLQISKPPRGYWAKKQAESKNK